MNKLNRRIISGLSLMIFTTNVFAFTKLKNGFETITNSYLIPLAGAVAGAALITFLLMAYFNPEANLKKAASAVTISVLIYGSLEILTIITQSFS